MSKKQLPMVVENPKGSGDSWKSMLLAAGTTSVAIAKAAIGWSCIEVGGGMIIHPEKASDVFFGAGFVIAGVELTGSAFKSAKRIPSYFK